MDTVLTHNQLLDHWLGHRRLTRRVIEAFPDDEAFTTFAVGEMRPFGVLVNEFLSMAVPTLQGIVSGEWPQIPEGRFQETDTAFGQWEMRVGDLLFYVIDNEVHHRGQGYVYLRALGVEPPQFPDRS